MYCIEINQACFRNVYVPVNIYRRRYREIKCIKKNSQTQSSIAITHQSLKSLI